MHPRLAPALAAALLLAACGTGGSDTAVPADTTGAIPPAVDAPGRMDDAARARVDSANAAVRARESEVDALSREAAGQGN